MIAIALHRVQLVLGFIIITISDLHHYECTTSRTGSSEPYWLLASVIMRLWDPRSFRTVFIHVIRGRPGSHFQSSGRSAVRIFLASALSSNRAVFSNRKSRCAWIVEVRRGWPFVHRPFETNWYRLMPNSLQTPLGLAVCNQVNSAWPSLCG